MRKLLFLLSLTYICSAQSPELVIPSGLKEITGIYDVNVSSDEKFLIAIAGRNIQIYNYETGVMYKNIVSSSSMSSVSFSKDNQLAYVSGDDLFLVIDLNTMVIGKQIPNNFGGLQHKQTTDNKYVYFGYDEGIGCFDTNTQTIRTVKEFPDEWGSMTRLSVSPDGKQLLISMYEYKTQAYRDFTMDTSGNILKELNTQENVAYVSFTPKGNILLVKRPSEDDNIHEFSWLNPSTLKPVGQSKNVLAQSLYAIDERFSFVPNSDDLWGGFMRDTKLELVSPNKALKEIKFSGFKHQNTYGIFQAKAVRITQNQTKAVIGTDDNQVVEIDLQTGSQTRRFGYKVYAPNYIASNPKFKGLAMLDNDNTLVCLYLEKGHIKQKIVSKRMTPPVFSNNGKWLVSGSGGTTTLWESNTLKEKFKIYIDTDVDFLRNSYGSVAASFSPDDRFVAIHGSKEVQIVNTNGGNVLSKIPTKAGRSFFSKDGRTLYVYYKYPYAGKEENYMQSWDIATAQKRWETVFNPTIFKALLRSEGDKCVIYDISDGIIGEINLSTGSFVKVKQNLNTLYAGADLSASGKFITDQGKIYDAQTLQLRGTRPGKGYVKTGHFYNNDVLLINPLETNDIQFTDWEKVKVVGQLIMLEEEDAWAFVRPDGRFDASPSMLPKLYYSKGTQIIPLETLSEKYYTPKLLTGILEGETIEEPQEEIQDIKELKSPPSVKIGVPQNQRNLVVADDNRYYSTNSEKINLNVQATCPDEGIDEIRLYHNGKLLDSGTRNLIVADDRLQNSKNQTFEVQLNEGINTFKAIALNTQRTESQPDAITVSYKPESTVKPNSGTNEINLHLLVIGINKYKNPKYNLNYATADAVSFKDAIEKGNQGVFAKINTHYIGDENATKQGIVAVLDGIKNNANLKDVFLLYYAGHGVLNTNKQFFLVPHDVTQLYGNDGALAEKGLSTDLIKQYAGQIKAQKQLFILDACQSAGALETLAMRGAAEEKAIAQLARSTGTHWLTASGSEQFASEFATLGHGTFTYVLLEALTGKADTSGDKKLTVKEVDAYLQTKVPELSEKYKGTPQFPASYGFGNDFPISVLK